MHIYRIKEEHKYKNVKYEEEKKMEKKKKKKKKQRNKEKVEKEKKEEKKNKEKIVIKMMAFGMNDLEMVAKKATLVRPIHPFGTIHLLGGPN